MYNNLITELHNSPTIFDSHYTKEISRVEAELNVAMNWPHGDLDRLESSKVVEEAESGSTATVVFARSDRLVLAYVGDSRVVRYSLSPSLSLPLARNSLGNMFEKCTVIGSRGTE